MTTAWAAPGRVTLIGEHVDYNDGLVLAFAVPWTTSASVTQRADRLVTVSSEGSGEAEFPADTSPGDVDGWVAYVAGVVWALRERGLEVPGMDLTISSEVPLGAGLSSSAALTCSVGCAINDDLGFRLSREDVAAVARAAENDFVGVATGGLDQLASMLCEPGSVLLIDCRSLETRQIDLPLQQRGLTLLLIDTGVRHELAGSEYGDRRSDCERAAEELGLLVLRDATLEQLERLSSDRLRRRARHVITEMERVVTVADLLAEGRGAQIGPLLTASHESLRDDFVVSCSELDVTVDEALAAGALGARMVGGGFGGCVIALCRDEDEAAVRQAVAAAYDARGWAAPAISTPLPSAGAHRVDRPSGLPGDGAER